MNKILNYFSEVKNELLKVIWPKREDVVKLTLVVFLISIFMGIYTGGLDFLFTKGLALFVSK